MESKPFGHRREGLTRVIAGLTHLNPLGSLPIHHEHTRLSLGAGGRCAVVRPVWAVNSWDRWRWFFILTASHTVVSLLGVRASSGRVVQSSIPCIAQRTRARCCLLLCLPSLLFSCALGTIPYGNSILFIDICLIMTCRSLRNL